MEPIQYCVISVHTQEEVQQVAERVVTHIARRDIIATVEADKTRRLYLTLTSDSPSASITSDEFRDTLGELCPGMLLLLLQFDESS